MTKRTTGRSSREFPKSSLNGQDPRAYIVSVNLQRRNLTKGQQAMALAMVYPEPAKLKRGSLETKQPDVHKTRLSQARTVLRHSEALAKEVMRGTTSLLTAGANWVLGRPAVLRPHCCHLLRR